MIPIAPVCPRYVILPALHFRPVISPMNIALDIDGTITRQPEFFALLSEAVHVSGGKVYIVTSRSSTAEVRSHTYAELQSYGIHYDDLILISDAQQDRIPCPHTDLDWYRQYLWQKVSVCRDREVDVVFEDDAKVVELFRTYAPRIQVFQVV